MHGGHWRNVLAAAISGTLAASAAGQCAPERLVAVDAVELAAGREIKGEPERSITRGAFTYLFATEANKAAFEKMPEKYEIQLGGACARMGPLSGMGRSDIFATHEGRLYVFASPQCRASFQKAPEKLLETDDAPVKADAASLERGRRLIGLAVEAAGGRERLRLLKAFRQTIAREVESGGKMYATSKGLTVSFPNRFRMHESWDASGFGQFVAGDTGAFVEKDADRGALAPSQVRAVKRIVNRHPLVILKAAESPGFLAAALGPERVGGREVERVSVSFDGTTTTLGIDPESGTIWSLSYTGRGARLSMGAIDQLVSEHRTIDGVSIPWSWTGRFDGQPDESLGATLTEFEIDPVVGEELFVAPDPG